MDLLRRVQKALALVGLGAALASCSSNRSDQLRLGAGIALTGNAGLLGQDARTGLDLAKLQFAQLQPRLELELEDTGSDEVGATVAFRRLINAKPVAILGPSLSQQGFAVMPMADRAGIPVIGVSTTAPGIPQLGPFVARVASPVTVVAPRSLAKALQLNPGIRRVAVFFAQDDVFCTSETQIFQQAIRAKGLDLVAVQRTSVADTDFQIPITNVLRSRPQLVVISALVADGGNLVRQLRELGYQGQIVAGNGLNTPNIYPVCQKHCDGMLITQAYNPSLDNASNRDLLKLFRRGRPADAVPPQVTAQAYTGYQVVHEALAKLKGTLPKGQSLTSLPLADLRQRLLKTLLAGTYQTPLGELRFSPEGEVVQRDFSVARVSMDADGRSGRFVLQP
ncbi:ABC transporter substrate-binding protein [Cyanobium sp. WAJ14-Wanaka]|uniref:ABC transporter substrate-binding protein n=1 Tax=Cyanobium sp. WAJ14-Wanaka TaxID=2823725 RepID=UPI0020CE6D4F|nr:ABC transporter substrate-binding protein [Cyanobium sp. WAJ14-Wanaka]MCP9775024.1 ABC transporter substrate-binding protein [Cyanobium sp. WAJ14-Wanaka]